MRIKNIVLICLLLTASLSAEGVRINFTHLKISQFIQMVASITENNILVEQEIKGEVNFHLNRVLEKEELMSLLGRVLKSKKMVMMDKGGFYTIVPERDFSF